jgi:hypothetical protein
MRALILFVLLAGLAGAQPSSTNAKKLRGKPPCSASITSNCIPNVDAAGNLAMVTTLPADAVLTVPDATLTLTAAHNGKGIKFTSAAAVTVTVPAGLPVGFACVLSQRGAGAITITGVGATVGNVDGTTTTKGVKSIATIYCDTANDCLTGGHLQ